MTAGGPRGWGAPLYAAVLDATAVRRGTALLDLGCGPGLLARAAADRGARVTGIDLDPAAVARAAAEVPEAAFAVGDAADPPSGPFDVVAAVQLLPHLADPEPVLRAAGRVGRVVAVTDWGRPGECDVRVFGEALAPLLGVPPRPADPAGGDPGRLRALLEAAGLRVARTGEVSCPFDYAGEDDVLAELTDSALGRAALRRAGPVAVRTALLDRLAPYRTGRGGYRLENLSRVLVATPPADPVTLSAPRPHTAS